jgi:hypothetical protein
MSLDWDTLSWFQAKPNISDIDHLINQNNILFEDTKVYDFILNKKINVSYCELLKNCKDRKQFISPLHTCIIEIKYNSHWLNKTSQWVLQLIFKVKQQSLGIHVAWLGYIILIPSQAKHFWHRAFNKSEQYTFYFFRRYFVKYLCRCYGTDSYQTICADCDVNIQRWISLPELQETCWSSTKWTSLSSHWNVTYSHHAKHQRHEGIWLHTKQENKC